jgi:hypothetical protein
LDQICEKYITVESFPKMINDKELKHGSELLEPSMLDYRGCTLITGYNLVGIELRGLND